ncbi:GGDEF domain-containing protein [Chitinibacter sp. SCUT-21]|uniref:diguanylate cyclase domain-containing protein n=1 Tax=Chitinibacter sp. SCUT-21 TaxID=2970891 RepID=UPI0035A6A024
MTVLKPSDSDMTASAPATPLPSVLRYAARAKRERREQRWRLALSLACLSLLAATLMLAIGQSWYWAVPAPLASALLFFYAAFAASQGRQYWEWRISALAVFIPPVLLSSWAWLLHAQLPPATLALPFVLQPILLLLAGLPIKRYIAAVSFNLAPISYILLSSDATFIAAISALLVVVIASFLGVNTVHRLVYHQRNLMLMRQRVAENAEKMAERDQKMRKLAFEDPLTGLANRLHLINQLRQTLKNPRAEAMNSVVYLIDLDFFKTVNDEFGHAAGDALLIEIAQRFKSLVRRGDLVCRLGGDEFVILVRGIHQASEIATVAEKILAKLSEPVWYEERQLPLGGSIGIAPWFPDLRSPASWLQAADDAMYAAKTGGRNRYVIADYHPNSKDQS